MKKTLILLFIALGLNIHSQTTYTVSNTDGGADYASLSALQTDISNGTFDGGANINFNRGDTLVGSLTITNHDGVSGTPIKFGTYGTGADPVITNEVTVTDSWSVYSGNIRQVTLSGAPSDIRFLFADGVNQKLGKTPNSGYYKLNTTGSNTTTLVDDDLTQADDYWNGYTITIHTAPWAIEQRSITDYDSATHTMTVSALGYQPGGFSDSLDAGYIFQNHLGTLDEQGEWYYNTGANVLYFYGDPAGVEFTYAPTGDLITLSGSDYITFENITFRGSDGYAVTGSNSDHTIIDSCNFYYLNSAVYSVNSDYDTIKNSYLEDIATNGVEFARVYYGDISYNEFNRVANVFGEGDDADGGDDMKGIHLNAVYQNGRYEGCDSVRVFANRIDSVGHSGIHFQMGDNSLIDANYITEYCQLKFDAGGIYAWHNADSAHIPGEVNYVIDYDSSFVTRNYLELNYDNLDKTWMTSQVGNDTIAPVYDIYIDDGNMNFRIDSNVMIGGAYNMFIHNSGHSYIRNNITYKSRVYGFFVRNNLDANKDTLTDSYIQDNIWVEYWDGSEEIYKHNEYLLYVDPSYNNTWSGNYNMFPFGKLYGSTDIVSGYDDTRGSFSYNVTEWNALSDVSNEDIHPFSYSDTDLSDIDSLIFIVCNFSDSPISTNSVFQNGYAYYDVDSTRIQEETIAAYESKVYLVDQGDYTYGSEPEVPATPASGSVFVLGGKLFLINRKVIIK